MTKLQRVQLESVLRELEIELIRVEREMDEVRLLLRREARHDRVHRKDRRCSRRTRRGAGELARAGRVADLDQDISD